MKLTIATIVVLFISSSLAKKHHKKSSPFSEAYDQNRVTLFKGDPVPIATQSFHPTSMQVVTPTYSVQSTFTPNKWNGQSMLMPSDHVIPYTFANSQQYQIQNNEYNEQGKKNFGLNRSRKFRK